MNVVFLLADDLRWNTLGVHGKSNAGLHRILTSSRVKVYDLQMPVLQLLSVWLVVQAFYLVNI